MGNFKKKKKKKMARAVFEPICSNAQWAHMHHFASVTKITGHYYRPRSEGDNVLGSVRPSVRLSPIIWHVRIIARMRSIGF